MKEVPFSVLGLGGVGSTLLLLLHDDAMRARIEARSGVRFRPVLLADSRGLVADPAGLPHDLVDAAMHCKHDGGCLSDLPGAAPAAELTARLESAADGIVVDCTASDNTGPLLMHMLSAGAGVVLANKRPLTASWEQWTALTATRRLRHEATVGAGLPVISTLAALLDSGDEVLGIQGCFSGTLAYLCSALNRGDPYSTSVAAARAAGYTEPDPRDDLCGLDVARKALILARMCGRRLELADLDVRPMIPAALSGVGLDEFMARLPEADAEMESVVRSAAAQNRRLAYVADLTPERPVIGLKQVDASSTIGRLNGTDNIVLFMTQRYSESPLTVQGPGAGRLVTAAGVLGDMIALAREELL
jgi:homoserine dehydrogenase